jgi:methyl-accepting chemotaxis protein
MKNVSIIFRIYIGFSFLCIIILVLGGTNWVIQEKTIAKVELISEDAFSIQTQARKIASDSLRMGKQVLDMTSLKTSEAVEEQYLNSKKRLLSLEASLQAISVHADKYKHAKQLSEPILMMEKDLSDLSALAIRTHTLLLKKHKTAQAVRDELSALLLVSAEMKQAVSKQSRSKASSDIYVSELVTTIINQFSNVEYLLLKMMNTSNTDEITSLVENIRFNTTNFTLDIADLEEEVPELSIIKKSLNRYLSGISSEDGIVNRYYQYRQNLSLISAEVSNLSALISHIDKILQSITKYGEDQVEKATTTLHYSVNQSNNITLAFLAIALLIAILISVFLARTIRLPLRATLAKVGLLAKGDFSSPMSANQSGEFIQLAASVNQLIKSMQEILNNLTQSTVDLAGVSESNQQVSDQVKERLSKQNLQIASVASAITQMEAAIAEVAHNTVISQNLSKSVDSEVINGQLLMTNNLSTIESLDSQMEKTSTGITKLSDSSKKISTIIAEIEGIAQRTNLLALNAAIEAARAGEQGRGFAVVADEVRDLASRTANSTESIINMISEVNADADNAVDAMSNSRKELNESKHLIQQASTTMNTIRHSMDQIQEITNQVNIAMQEQQHVATEITENINGISTVANENFSQIEILAENGTSLKNQTFNIEEIIKRFKLSRDMK